jgi:hypothetical protein
MDGNDPTTTIPAAAGGSNLVLVLILALIATVLATVAMRVLYRSLRPQAGPTIKAVAGALCAVLAFDLAILVAVTGGNILLAFLVGLVGLAAIGYAIPAVRGFVMELRHHHSHV